MSLKHSPEHVWIAAIDPAQAAVGITVHAQEALGDVVFVDLPAIGQVLKQGDVAGVVESVKAASDVFMPVDGEVVAVNEALRADPALANQDPMGAGWFFKVRVAQPVQLAGLLDSPAYEALLKTL